MGRRDGVGRRRGSLLKVGWGGEEEWNGVVAQPSVCNGV